jgi:hypothetical protein
MKKLTRAGMKLLEVVLIVYRNSAANLFSALQIHGPTARAGGKLRYPDQAASGLSGFSEDQVNP